MQKKKKKEKLNINLLNTKYNFYFGVHEKDKQP